MNGRRASKQAYRGGLGLGLDPTKDTDSDDGKYHHHHHPHPHARTFACQQNITRPLPDQQRTVQKINARNKGRRKRKLWAWTERGRNIRRTSKYQAQTMPVLHSLSLSLSRSLFLSHHVGLCLSPDLPEAGREAGKQAPALFRNGNAVRLRSGCFAQDPNQTRSQPAQPSPARGYMQFIHTRGKGTRTRARPHPSTHPSIPLLPSAPCPGTYLPVSGGPSAVGLLNADPVDQ
ncbi:uncharacterized protein IWZ02DRAFT_13831 [Phyllosticta citriasiana]|uniref:uncharacterized protein n=1 Tax=Phyllosticta citriasiana TaxID=595635 RepID=UPI0030FD3177